MSVGGGRRGCRPGAQTAGGSALFVSTRCGRLPRPLAPSHPSWHLFCLPGDLRAAPLLQGPDPLLPGSRRPGRLYALWLSLGLGLAPLACTRWGFRSVWGVTSTIFIGERGGSTATRKQATPRCPAAGGSIVHDWAPSVWRPPAAGSPHPFSKGSEKGVTFAAVAMFEPLHHSGGSRGRALRTPAGGNKVMRGSCSGWPRGCRSQPENPYLSGSHVLARARPHPPHPRRPQLVSWYCAGCPGGRGTQGLAKAPNCEVCSWRQGQWEEKGACDLWHHPWSWYPWALEWHRQGSRAEKTSLSWALGGLRGLGEQATPPEDQAWGSPGSRGCTLVTVSGSPGGCVPQGEVTTCNRCCLFKIT